MVDDEVQNNSDCNVANIKLYGDIDTYGTCPECASSSDEIMNQIKDAEDNGDIKAIVLNIDSSGGGTVASQEIANAMKYAQKTTVALIRSGGMSGGYFAATGADRIFASSMSNIGSIGITSSYLDNVEKNKKDGLTYNELSIGKFKDAGSPDRPLTAEERALWLADLKIGYDIFVASVAENRGLDLEKVKLLADGNTMKGQKALDNGLIDQLGDMFDVEKYLSDKLGEKAIVCR